jgi:hypothetical protein
MTLSNLRLILSPTLRLSPVCLQIIVEEREILFPIRASLEAALLSPDLPTSPHAKVASISSSSKEDLPGVPPTVRSPSEASSRPSPVRVHSDTTSSLAQRPTRGESLRASVSEPRQLPFSPSHAVTPASAPASYSMAQQTEVLDSGKQRSLSPSGPHSDSSPSEERQTQHRVFSPPQTSEGRQQQQHSQPPVQAEIVECRPSPPPSQPGEFYGLHHQSSSPFLQQTNESTSSTSLPVNLDVPRDDRLTSPPPISPTPTPIADRFSSSSGSSTPKLPASPKILEPQQPYKPYVPSRNLDFKPLFAAAPASPDLIKRKGSATSVESPQSLRSGSVNEEKETTPPRLGVDDDHLDTTATPTAIKEPMVDAEPLE